jgi:hypothetical protein
MAAKKTTLKELGDMLAHVVEHMATKEDVAAITRTQDDHTRDLAIIKRDVETNLDKRLQIEVRVDELEKKVFGADR